MKIAWGWIGVLALAAAAPAYAGEEPCRRLGTAIEWEPSIEQAQARARKEGKLLFVLHVSGKFEDPELT
jgi:hypothetical protein